jgi:4-hydroxybenzoate polyprenyltransferase
MDTIKNYFYSMRPTQWIKNLLVFGFIFFNQDLYNLQDFKIVFFTFIAFIFVSSSIYLINDVIDYKRDALHPIKRKRIIASGKIPRDSALIFSFILFIIGLVISFYIGEYLLLIYILYYILFIIYSVYLKNILIIDALTTASGFVLRVLAGGVVIGLAINSWFVIFIICASLFIAFGKRRAEVTMMSFKKAIVHRTVLSSYPKELLDNLISMTAAITFLSYILFSYNEDIHSKTPNIISSLLPSHLKNPHWFKITIPIAFYILARYMYNIYVNKTADTPETIWFKDRYILISIMLYILASFVTLYLV